MATETIHSSPHPLTPPLTEEDSLDWLRLLRSRRVGVATFHRLIDEYGTAREALRALPEIARAAGVADYAPASRGIAEAEYAAGRRAGARLVAVCDPDYPHRLAGIADAPPLVWAIGRAELALGPVIAVVGARNASSLGLRMARRIAGELSEAGVAVVSGLARGIDTVVHDASLDRGTIAVMPGGVDVPYPQQNTHLHRDIGERGLLVSEAPMHTVPQARHFPARNRIVSGIAQAVVVVEAAVKSGSMITARTAADQGRDVMAVPGHPFDSRATGCNLLIRDGARLVRDAADVLEGLDLRSDRRLPATAARGACPGEVVALRPSEAPRAAPPAQAAALPRLLLERLSAGPCREDDLIRGSGLGAAEVAQALVMLELDGVVRRFPGGQLARVA